MMLRHSRRERERDMITGLCQYMNEAVEHAIDTECSYNVKWIDKKVTEGFIKSVKLLKLEQSETGLVILFWLFSLIVGVTCRTCKNVPG